MAEPIQHKDIIESEKILAEINKIVKQLNKLEKSIKKTASTLKDFQQKQDPSTPAGKRGTQQTITETEKLAQKLKKLQDVRKGLNKEVIRATEENRKYRQALKQEVAIEGNAKGSLNRMRAEYNKLNRAYNAADAVLRKKLVPQMAKLDKAIKQNEEAVGRHTRSVGRYQKAFANAKSAILSFGVGMLGATAIIRGLGRAMKNSVSVVLNFDQAMADVHAITRATDEQMSMLRESAKALGGSTKFTASEVAALQKELGKLGFKIEEILAGTGGILALAAATGEDLAKSAEVAGNAMRAFGLDASESGRVADVMARAFTGSALTLERFSVAMRSVAPVAKAAGFSIEETTALLGSLANAGFDASMAGTATRNILLNLADTSGALAKKLGGAVSSFDELIPALIQLRDGGVSLNETLELTDKRSVAAFNRFLEGAEFTREFKEELLLASGAAQEMSEIALNTMKGDLIILKSAWQGMIIEMKDFDSGADKIGRGATRQLTKWLRGLTQSIKNNVEWTGQLTEGMKELLLPTVAIREETERLAEVERLAAIAAEEKKAAQLAEIARQERLLELAILRADHINNFVIPAEEKITESQNKGAEDQVSILSIIEGLRESEAEFDQAELEHANNIFNAEKKVTDQHLKNLEDANEAETENAKISQKISLGQSIISLAQGLANTAKAGFPINVPLIIGYLSQVAGIIGTITGIKFEKGGHGELDGPSHSSGGIHIPGVGEGEGHEYFGIINKQMTRKYRQDLPSIFDSLNAGNFHDVWDRANIQIQTNIDPWTKKIYDTLQTQANIYTDSDGNTVKEYPSGHKQIIIRG